MFAAAELNRLTSSWTTANTSADADIRQGLKPLRARARELSKNNDYARRYLKLCVTNIVGPGGVKFQCKAQDAPGKLDTTANRDIEAAWAEWSRFASMDGQLSWLDILRIIVETTARDGEILIRYIRGKGARNRFNYALQLIESDHLDESLNDEGRRLKMGIEYDENGTPTYYHLWKHHPGDNVYASFSVPNERIRVPASELLHVYYKERPSQSRGIPWMTSAMTRMKNLGAYEEAEIVAARVAAAKMGFFTSPDGEGLGEKDGNGDFITEAEPGSFDIAPVGYDLKIFDPTHPSGNFGPFMKATLRGISAGLGVSYNSLANDLESVNYSSLRGGSIDERDNWMTIQAWLIHNVCNPIYAAFLDMALLSGAIKYPYTKYDKYNAPFFQARRWQWVDPQKDVGSNINAIEANLKTRTRALAEEGLDFMEVIDQLAFEEQYMKEKGVSAGTKPAQQNPKGDDNEDGTKPDDTDK